ncbi:MAG: hypothetical protein CFE43_11970 [Burkholderiales bacterium PBB3]|nr:MAG: hypothetical protein CFE43_11970 [Burkholderiales bacterium PBB3]
MFAVFCSFFALLTPNAHAAAPAANTVDVGVYLNNIPAVSLKEKKFQVDFNIWFRWQDDKLNPMESFKIFNGYVDAKDGLIKKKIGNVNYAMQRVQATIFRNFDVERYPLDNHLLKIQIEDYNPEGAQTTFVADIENTNVSPKITVPGWTVGKFESYASTTSYNTNYGDSSVAKDTETKLPRYTFAVELKRAGFGYFFKYFSILLLAATLTFVAFRISPELIDTRFWLITTSFFLAVITGSSLEANLPQSESFGLGDMLYNLTMLCILVSTVVMIYHHRMFVVDPERTLRLSRLWAWGLPLVYLAAVVFVVFKG